MLYFSWSQWSNEEDHSEDIWSDSAHCFTNIIFSFYSCRKIMKLQQTLKQTVYSCFSAAAEIWQKLLGGTCLLFFILLLIVEKLEIILNKHKKWHWFCAVYFCLTLLIKMCFLISIFLCFALVPKLVPRTVDFHWYWYRILKFWYRDNPSAIIQIHLLVGLKFYMSHLLSNYKYFSKMYILVRVIALSFHWAPSVWCSEWSLWSLAENLKVKAHALLVAKWKYFHGFLTFTDGEYTCEM